MEIEMFVGFPEKTWDTKTIEIPDDTPEADINDVAADTLMRKLEEEGTDVAFVGVFKDKEE